MQVIDWKRMKKAHYLPNIIFIRTCVELFLENWSKEFQCQKSISLYQVNLKLICQLFLFDLFFNLNTLSSPILVKVHFDVVMTMIADTLYNMLAQKLRGFQDCDAPKIYRHFIKGKANITLKNENLTVTYPRRAHNPILRAVPWHRLPNSISWLDSANLDLKFKWI